MFGRLASVMSRRAFASRGHRVSLVGFVRRMFLVGVASAFLLFVWTWHALPPGGELLHLQGRTTFIVDVKENGTIQRVDTKSSRPVDSLPSGLEALLLFREDRRFHEHFGICYRGLARAVAAPVLKGRVEGASGITQQVVKNAWLGRQRTLYRKWKEAVYALKLTHELEKLQILLLHLNAAYLGGNIYGIEAAARNYFFKSSAELNLYECAILVEMLRSPHNANVRTNRTEAEERARTLLNNAQKAGVITLADKTRALRQGIQKGSRTAPEAEFSWAFDYIRPLLERELANKPGRYHVITSVNAESQIYAQHTIAQKLGSRSMNTQAAMVSLAPDGAVLAMVGARDYAGLQFNLAVDARRQPGSLFKLFLYLAALESGHSASDIVLDAPVNGWPRNFDNRYHGRVRLDHAFANSLNAAAINLARDVGFENVFAMAERFAILKTDAEPEAQMLGTGEASLLDMTRAYATIANGGVQPEPHAVLLIRDLYGNVIYRRPSAAGKRIVERELAQDMEQLLRRVVTNGTGRAAATGADLAVCGKTGSTNQDAWFVAYTPEMCTGIWVGNMDNAPIGNLTGGGLPAEVFHDYTATLYKFQDVQALSKPFLETYPQRTTFAEKISNSGAYLAALANDPLPVEEWRDFALAASVRQNVAGAAKGYLDEAMGSLIGVQEEFATRLADFTALTEDLELAKLGLAAFQKVAASLRPEEIPALPKTHQAMPVPTPRRSPAVENRYVDSMPNHSNDKRVLHTAISAAPPRVKIAPPTPVFAPQPVNPPTKSTTSLGASISATPPRPATHTPIRIAPKTQPRPRPERSEPKATPLPLTPLPAQRASGRSGEVPILEPVSPSTWEAQRNAELERRKRNRAAAPIGESMQSGGRGTGFQ